MTDDYQRGFEAGERSYKIYMRSVLEYTKSSLQTSGDPDPKMSLKAIINLLDDVESDNTHP